MDIHSAFVGIDGCKAGWVAVILSADGQWATKLYPSIDKLWQELREARLLLIDTPIGLPSAEGPVRKCDAEARRLLKPLRASSIFPAPIRFVLDAPDYEEANFQCKELASRGLSKQTWHLVRKIREVDALMQSDPTAKEKLYESHPELCIAALSDDTVPMRHNKKTRTGYDERAALLEKLYPQAALVVDQAMKLFKRKEVGRDDAVDALILAVAALCSGGSAGLTAIPLQQEQDETGLPMRIVFFRRNHGVTGLSLDFPLYK